MHERRKKFPPTQMDGNVQDFFAWIEQNKHLKTVTTPLDGFELVDVGIKSYGGDTGVYMKNRDLQIRMRRGLTFIRRGSDLEITRQGLPKFFDLDLEDIVKRGSSSIPDTAFPVTIYHLEKLNGENAQISWCDSIQRWIVCSKNVAIAAKDLETARHTYGTSERFRYALHIARHWFEGTLPHVKDVESLKELLSQNTLVGEVVDLTNAQHIVDNPKKHGLIFFAIVSKKPSGENTPLCVLPDQAIPIFQRHQLNHVEIGDTCTLTSRENITDLKRFVDKISTDASSDPYVCLSEGSVVYASESSTGRILFLAKLKTSKYRVLRRLRELMKRAATKDCLPGGIEEMKMRNGYKQDVRKWGLDETTYTRLFDVANRTRVAGKWDQRRIGDWYIDFLRECIKQIPVAHVTIPAPVLDTQIVNHESELESSADEDDSFAKQQSMNKNSLKSHPKRKQKKRVNK